ncbi:helix-turn-helix domain-containing protein [Kribbella sp. NPDC048915]|uniref:TetR/AcrR family transcriptional regulator n=1 Tax=Kribbella sp. NPDC048915 TaxID=3155148 RepID=UPI00340CA04A
MTTSVRPPRADAARNREALLAAAEAEFAERGIAASVADIARRAGVVKGTVFRHFATKEDLIAAIVIGHIATLSDEARKLLGASDPEAALREFLTVAADQRHQHNLTFLQTASAGNTAVLAARDELIGYIGQLVDAARAAGAIRADVTAIDVFLMMCAPIHIMENSSDPSPSLWQRYLGILFDGLRPEGASPLTQPAPSKP